MSAATALQGSGDKAIIVAKRAPKKPGAALAKRSRGKAQMSPDEVRALVRAAVRGALESGEEVKFFDTSQQYAQVDRAGTLVNFSQPAQGTGVNQRVGDAIVVKGLEVRLTCYYNTGATNVQHALRVVIFKWNISSGGAFQPSLATVFQFPGAVGDYRVVTSPFNWQLLKQEDMTVIYDELVSVGPSAGGYVLAKKFPLHSTINFDTGLTSGEGFYYMYLLADDLTGGHTPDLQVQFCARLTYTDA